MSIHWKIYHFLQPNFVKIEMLLDICFICIFLTNWFDSILLRSKDLEEIPGLITNVIHWNSQSLRTKYIYASVYFYDVFSNWEASVSLKGTIYPGLRLAPSSNFFLALNRSHHFLLKKGKIFWGNLSWKYWDNIVKLSSLNYCAQVVRLNSYFLKQKMMTSI